MTIKFVTENNPDSFSLLVWLAKLFKN